MAMLYRISSSLYLSSKYIFYATEHTAIHSRIIAKSNIYLQCTPCLLAKGHARDRACSKGILCASIYAVLSAPKPFLVREKSSAGMVQCFRTWVRVLHWTRSFWNVSTSDLFENKWEQTEAQWSDCNKNESASFQHFGWQLSVTGMWEI